MEFLLNRYRNLTVLLVAIFAQLALLAYQVKSSQDVRLIRVWAESAVTPLARVFEAGRSGTSHFFHDYFLLLGVREEKDRMKAELEQAQLDNQYLRSQLASAENAKALSIFKITSRSKTLAAHNIGRTTDTSAQVIRVDRGSLDGVQKGMAVVTPEGIVGKVINVYPTASHVLLITDPSFAAFVVSAKHHVHGTLKGKGDSTVIVDHVENEEVVEPGEVFLTSGDDLIFPRGTPAGQVTKVYEGRKNKEIYLTPTGIQNGVDGVLIVIDGVHGTIPDAPALDEPVHLLPVPAPDGSSPDADVPAQSGARMTDMDRAVQNMKALGAAQGHTYGDKNTPAPNFNLPAAGNPASPQTSAPHP
jgi:rod shape-determining protein MreC